MTAPRLAWGSAAVAALVLLAGWGLSLAGSSLEASTLTALVGAIVVGFAGVGALIASRHPANPIGWLFCGIGVAGALMSLSRGYAEYWLDGNAASTSLGELAASYGDVSWIPAILPAATFLLLLFPNGRLPSRRWRPVAWCAGLGIALLFVGDFTSPGPLEDYPHVVNPYGVDSPVLDLVEVIGALLLLVAARRLAAVTRRSGFGAPAATSASRSSGSRFAGAVAAVTPRDRRRRLRRPERAGRKRRDHAEHPGAAGGRRRRDPALPPLRHRRRDQPHAGLRRADGDAGAHLPRQRPAAPARAERLTEGSGWPSPRPRSRWRRWSAPPARASRQQSTAASTGANMTRSAPSRRSRRASVTRWTLRP